MIMSTKEICKRGLSMTISLTLGNTPLPLAHGGVGDEEALGQLLLGQPQFLAALPQEGPKGFLVFHGFHTPCLNVPCKTGTG